MPAADGFVDVMYGVFADSPVPKLEPEAEAGEWYYSVICTAFDVASAAGLHALHPDPESEGVRFTSNDVAALRQVEALVERLKTDHEFARQVVAATPAPW